jgi:hypothetical protein
MSFLPGHFPAGAPSFVEKLTTLTFIGSAGDGDNTVTIPLTVREGDFLFLFAVGGEFGGGAQNTAPDGFTVLQARWGSGNVAVTVSAKIAAAADAGASINALGGPNFNNPYLLHFRGNSKGRAVSSAQDAQYVETSANPAAITLDSSAATVPALAFGLAWTSGADAPQDFPDATGTVSINAPLAVGYTIFNAGDTPTDTAWDMGDGGGDNHLLAFYVNLT